MVDRTMLDLVDKLADPDLDPIKASAAIASLKSAVTASSRLEIEKRRIQIAQESAELDRDRFRFQVANQFLAWFEDARARKIAESSAPSADKVAQLLALMDEMER